jgi:uncharacterized membrane protein
MTEFDKLDTDNDGSLSKDEFAKLDVLNKRLTIQDADAKRNLERKLVTMSAIGLVLYPFIILLASVLGFDTAASLITDIASVYVVAASGTVVGYMGVNAIREKNQ